MRIYTVDIKDGDVWEPGLQFHKVDNAMSIYWHNLSMGIECRVTDNKGNVIIQDQINMEPPVLEFANDN